MAIEQKQLGSVLSCKAFPTSRKNLYRRLFKSHATEAEKMRGARLSVVFISVLSLLVALLMTDIISAYQWALRISTATLVVPFLAAMFWRRATSKGCASAMLSAIVVTVFWAFWGTGTDPVIPGMLTCLIVLVIVSMMTRHSPLECPCAVYWEDFPTAKSRAEAIPAAEKTAAVV
ncbi:hypothetical protein KUV26_20395 [Leisingera daeponensis]|uniref:Uncharacterized protein n=1 Tax=Leisingera daeponensis TaxID=405746 RepID=A0ABS7NM71_9RHOB|nr:hypothetical protein [Leisingera daeponensis]MBY6141804.1 hypothetical protein [Leisingera daeponensis]